MIHQNKKAQRRISLIKLQTETDEKDKAAKLF